MEHILEIIEGQVAFQPLSSSYLNVGGSSQPESLHLVVIRTGDETHNEALFARIKNGMRAGEPCYLKLPASTFQDLSEGADTKFFVRIIAVERSTFEGRPTLKVSVDLGVIRRAEVDG